MPDHTYVYGEVPPPAVAVALPSEAPLQAGSVPVTVIVNTGGLFNVELEDNVHAFASVTVIVYVPAAMLEIVAVVALFDQTYE